MGEQRRVGAAEGDIAERLTRAGLTDVRDGTLAARADYAGFDDFWQPFTFGVGPAGQASAHALARGHRHRSANTCRAALSPTGRSRSTPAPGSHADRPR